MTAFLLFLVISIAIAVVVVRGGDVVEPSTKHAYRETLSCGLTKLSLAGTGVRVKQIGPIAAKVYSAAMYVDKGDVASRFRASSRGSVEDAVVEAKSAKAILLKMARTVGADTMVNAIGESVRPRMKGKDLAALSRFQSLLLGGLKHGAKDKTLFRFDIAPGNSKLSCSIDGVSHGSVSSPTLCRAFASVYMGPGSVSPTLKDACTKSLTSWK
jgi:Chalcone isomerase-like